MRGVESFLLGFLLLPGLVALWLFWYGILRGALGFLGVSCEMAGLVEAGAVLLAGSTVLGLVSAWID